MTLPDGTYQAFVVDAEDGLTDDGQPQMHLSVTILAGEHKGEVLDITAQNMDRDSIDLLGMPATLVVTDGSPRLEIDDA